MERTNSKGRKNLSWRSRPQDIVTNDVIPVGNVPMDEANDRLDVSLATRPPIRIVHISDTHLQHEALLHETTNSNCSNPLPEGDILIHSGDFNRYTARYCPRSQHYEDLLYQIDKFFAAVPHKMKVFVAGNHEPCLEGVSSQQIQQHLPNCVYLCDSAVQYAGLNIYGSPYTASTFLKFAKGFAEPWRRLRRHWDLIPNNTDILVTHMPPLGILDLASEMLPKKSPLLFRLKTAILPSSTCSTCRFVHAGRQHWGCPALRDSVLNRIKPKLHLFGHVHWNNGTLQRDNTVFSNAAFAVRRQCNVFDYYTDSD